MNPLALFSDKTRMALINVLVTVRHHPSVIDDAILVLHESDMEKAVKIWEAFPESTRSAIQNFVACFKEDVESPKFMRVAMKAIMGGA